MNIAIALTETPTGLERLKEVAPEAEVRVMPHGAALDEHLDWVDVVFGNLTPDQMRRAPRLRWAQLNSSLERLRDGRLGGAAPDGFEQEPLAADSPFWMLPNVVVTPHLGAAWGGMWDAAFDLFCENLRRFRADEPLLNVANLERGY